MIWWILTAVTGWCLLPFPLAVSVGRRLRDTADLVTTRPAPH